MKPNLIGISRNIQEVKNLIQQVADTGFNTLVCGETGVGKELVAQSLYLQSGRKGKPFIKVNCAALPDTLLESEMFGYEQGAFTGALRKKRGKFEQADEGVLFLDEIGDMSFPLQSKLLHALQDGNFVPLGGERSIQSDAWIISATNHDLEEDLKHEKFRKDLYYRLGVLKIEIEPLRQRREDVPLLIEFYTRKFAAEFRDKQLKYPDRKIIEKLGAYHWPGNVRELQNVLKRIMILDQTDQCLEELFCPKENVAQAASSDPVTASIERFPIPLPRDAIGDPEALSSFSLKEIKKQAGDRIEREIISYALRKTGWNKTKATRLLEISYKALLYKIQNLNIQPPAGLA
jgi:transcriptional regulator with GAF, ATPase, and Fis domain